MLFVVENDNTKNGAVERRLAMGAFIVCFIEWLYTPYTFYVSMIDTTFVTADLERHYLITVLYYTIFSVVTPYTLFVTSPNVRKLFLNDWLRI
jgi:hypothetical protein